MTYCYMTRMSNLDQLLDGNKKNILIFSVQMSIPQMDGGADESPKRNRPKFQPLNIIKSPQRPNSGR